MEAHEQPQRRLLLVVGAVLATAWSIVEFTRLCVGRAFRLDEFQYAHSAWLVAHGDVPYRDFFDHHLALPYQALAPLWWAAGDDLVGIQWLRAGPWAAGIASAAAGAWLVRRGGVVAQTACVALLLTWSPLTERSIEIRPDAFGLVGCLAALALLDAPRIRSTTRCYCAGLATGIALLCTVKAWIYGAPLGVLALLSLTRRARQGNLAALPHPGAFLLATLAPLVVYGVWLAGVGALGPFVQWCIVWVFDHQSSAELFSPWPTLYASLDALPGWSLAALLGALALCAESRDGTPGWVLVLLLPTTLASYAIQKAPYPYSLTPFWTLLVIVYARGLATPTRIIPWIWRRFSVPTPDMVQAGRWAHAAVPVAILAVVVAAAPARATQLRTLSATVQLARLDRWNALIRPDEVVYDNLGAAVARRHAYYFFYTNLRLREMEATRFEREVPEAIRASEATARLNDARTLQLPESVLTFLNASFIRVDGDLSLWGSRLDGGTTEFWANRSGTHYLWPAERAPSVTIDGRSILAPFEIRLDRGSHTVRRTEVGEPVWLIWLPATGEHLAPLPPVNPRAVGI